MTETNTDPTALSPAAQGAVETKKVTGRWQFAKLRKLLDELAGFDAITDKAQGRAKGFTWLFIILTVVLSVVTVVLQVSASDGIGSPFVPLLSGVPALGLLVLAVVFGIRWRKLAKADLANEFREVLAPFLAAISADVDPKARVGARLDLSGMTKDKIISKKKIPPGRYRKIIETVYKDMWCDLAIAAADGSTLMLRIEDISTSFDRHWTTQSRSGKTKFKHKRKWKKLVVISAAVVPDGEKLSWDREEVEQLSDQEKLKFREKPKGDTCKLVRKFKFSSTGNPPKSGVSTEQIIGMYMQLYSLLKPAAGRS
jgi:hypothetical protein